MKHGGRLSLWAGAAPGILLVCLLYAPLAVLLAGAFAPSAAVATSPDIGWLVLRSAGIAAVIAVASVVLGLTPACLLAGAGGKRDIVLLAMFLPLVLPDYVLYYAWSLLLSPTTHLGSILSADPARARLVSSITSCTVLVFWHWPIAALIVGHAVRRMDPCVLDTAALDAGPLARLRHVTLPMLAGPMVLAFCVCFVLVLSSFTTFHLAGTRTIGTELAVLYEQTFSPAAVARAASPTLVPAVLIAILLGLRSSGWQATTVVRGEPALKARTWQWVVLAALTMLSVGLPMVLFVANLTGVQPFVQFFSLHFDQLAWGLLVAFCTAVIAYAAAAGVIAAGEASGSRTVAVALYSLVFMGMLMPGSLVAASLLELSSSAVVPEWFRQGVLIVSLGQAARFTGPVLILLLLGRDTQRRRLVEMASIDGASRARVLLHVHLPAAWRLLLSAFILIMMFSLAEIPATMILLPAGLPSYSQLLLNQMHYARDQQVIASSLVLMASFLVMAAVLVAILRTSFARMAVLSVALLVLAVPGCSRRSSDGHADILASFGTTGKGQSQFIYPRAIDICPDGTLFVADKAGRIQHLKADGSYIGEFSTPEIELGKPTGISVGPDGNLYVADTHYHRVLVYSPDGVLVRQWGRLGQDPGCFVYPTDVAFSGDGRIFVSEYGGNDRISVFDDKGGFLYSFGTAGEKDGQLSRPAAMAVDRANKLLYIADACNHRIGVFDFDGKLQRYIGSAGTGPGQLRYPYSIVLTDRGELVVCEFGNNRIQVFDTAGRSLAIAGSAGRQPGQLAYPWAVAVGPGRRAFIVDSGNNRIQIWRI